MLSGRTASVSFLLKQSRAREQGLHSPPGSVLGLLTDQCPANSASLGFSRDRRQLGWDRVWSTPGLRLVGGAPWECSESLRIGALPEDLLSRDLKEDRECVRSSVSVELCDCRLSVCFTCMWTCTDQICANL